MKTPHLVPCALALALLASPAARAQAPAAAPAAPASGFRAEALGQHAYGEKQILDLAEATPADKYGWRPAPGVRSISEVYIHIAGGNYLLLGFAGVKPPAGLDREMEKNVTEKAKVIDELKKSFAHVRAGIAATSDADLDKPVKMFGRDTTVRGVLLSVVSHEFEHLGQSIAYARMNGIVPPWTAEQQKRLKEAMEKKPADAPAKK
ncbi:MAG TPA: DinB family protein [Thermoanaerobaculia bacterium]|nr:DinB family protein [Thermoanaerobaculia bacterium]